VNYKLIATQIGDLLKWDTTINEINRIAKATFNFNASNFPNDSITSERGEAENRPLAFTCFPLAGIQPKSEDKKDFNQFLKLSNLSVYVASPEYMLILEKLKKTNKQFYMNYAVDVN
jgi:hypothetical protein